MRTGPIEAVRLAWPLPSPALSCCQLSPVLWDNYMSLRLEALWGSCNGKMKIGISSSHYVAIIKKNLLSSQLSPLPKTQRHVSSARSSRSMALAPAHTGLQSFSTKRPEHLHKKSTIGEITNKNGVLEPYARPFVTHSVSFTALCHFEKWWFHGEPRWTKWSHKSSTSSIVWRKIHPKIMPKCSRKYWTKLSLFEMHRLMFKRGELDGHLSHKQWAPDHYSIQIWDTI